MQQQLARICKALGDDNRIQIITILQGGETCACKLLEELQIQQPTLSHHMKILCDCGIVSSRKEGKWTHYRIDASAGSQFLAQLADILGVQA